MKVLPLVAVTTVICVSQVTAKAQIYDFVTIAGVAPGSADGTNNAARFKQPSGVVVDSAGNLYVADSGNYTIRKLAPVGTNWVSSTIAGLAGSYGSTDGTNIDARFGYPNGIAVDAIGNVYVADPEFNTIRKLTPVGTNWVSSTIAGSADDFSGSADGTNSGARFNEPRGVAVDRTGNVYVADTGNNTVRKLSLMGSNWVSSTIAGSAQFDQDGNPIAGSAGSADGTNSDVRFNSPSDVAVDSTGNIYVKDSDNRIRKLTSEGTNWVSSTIGPPPFGTPWGVAVDAVGNVYVSEDAAITYDIRRLTPVGTNWVASIIYEGDSNGRVAVDNVGNVYLADPNSCTISEIATLGTNWVLRTIAGLAAGGGSADGTNSNVQFSGPSAVAVDRDGNVFVADTGNSTIRKLTPAGTNLVSSTIAGLAWDGGSADGTNSDARFSSPSGLAVGRGGEIYVADSGNNTIRKLTPIGPNWVSSTIAGSAANWGSADGTNSQAQFLHPMGVAVDGAGNVYVVESPNSTIRKLTPVGTNWVSSTIAGLAGAPQDNADGTNRDARFDYPRGIAVDTAGNVYVADTGNDAIRKVTWRGTYWVTTTIAGSAIWGSADGTNSDARFASPVGVTVDGTGNVYVADTGNNTIRKLTPLGTNWVSSTVGGLPTLVGSADGVGGTARFSSPSGVAVDTAGNIYLADSANRTIRKGVPLTIAPSPPVFQTVVHINGLIAFAWSATSGRTYQLQYNSQLRSTNWSNLGGPLPATAGTISASDALGTDQQRFYRVVLVPIAGD